MHFYSGVLMYFHSGVDTTPTRVTFLWANFQKTLAGEEQSPRDLGKKFCEGRGPREQLCDWGSSADRPKLEAMLKFDESSRRIESVQKAIFSSEFDRERIDLCYVEFRFVAFDQFVKNWRENVQHF